jgi:hypothetical protein
MFLFSKYSKLPMKKKKKSKKKNLLNINGTIPIIIVKILVLICIFYFFVLFNHKLKYIYSIHKKISLSNINKEKEIDSIFKVNKTLDFENSTFGIVSRADCSSCGLFSYYSVHLGCILTYLSQGYIPIIEVGSFVNVFNNYTADEKSNPWEILFNQPFGYTLEEVKKNAKKIEQLSCSWTNMAPAEGHIYQSQLTLDFYRYMSKKYMSIKKEIMDEADLKWKQLFANSKNVLGVLGRGTDFVFLKPGGHSIPPSTEKMIQDVKNMDKKNKYDWIYLATEDDMIRHKFIQSFGTKLKMIQNKNIFYEGGYIGNNKNLHGIEFQKLYLISMIILSKCIDIVAARCSGAMGAFIFSEGFRETIVYFLGQF